MGGAQDNRDGARGASAAVIRRGGRHRMSRSRSPPTRDGSQAKSGPRTLARSRRPGHHALKWATNSQGSKRTSGSTGPAASTLERSSLDRRRRWTRRSRTQRLRLHAREEWRGLYSRQFRQRMQICTTDAGPAVERDGRWPPTRSRSWPRPRSASRTAARRRASGRSNRTTRAMDKAATSSPARTTSRRSRRRSRRRGSVTPPAPAEDGSGDGHQFRAADDLDRFAARSRGADDTLHGPRGRLRSAYGSSWTAPSGACSTSTRCWPASARSSTATRSTREWVAQDRGRVPARRRRRRRSRRCPTPRSTASLRAAGLLGGRQSVTFDDPVAYGMPPTTGYANDPVNTASGNFVELEDDLPFGGLLARAALRAHVQQPLRPRRRVRRRLVVVGRRAAARAAPTAPSTTGPTASARCSRAWATATGACSGVDALVEPRASRARAALVRRRALGVRRGRAARCAITRGPGTEVRAHATRTGGSSSSRHAGGQRVRVRLGRRADRGARVLGRPPRRPTATTTRATSSRSTAPAARAATSSATTAASLSVTDADGVVEVANAYDERGPRARAALAVRRATRLRLPARPRDGHQRRAPTARRTPTSTTPPGACSRSSTATRPAHGVHLRRVGQPRRGHRAQRRRDGPGVGRARAPRCAASCRPAPSSRSPTTTPTASSRSRRRPARGSATPTTATSAARPRSIDPEGGVTRLTVAGRARARDRRPRRRARCASSFDADGNIVAPTDADGNVARLERDAAGRVIAGDHAARAAHDVRPRRARAARSSAATRRRRLALRVHARRAG